MRARHAKPSRLRNLTLTAGLAGVVSVPLLTQPAAAHESAGRAQIAPASSAADSAQSARPHEFGLLRQGSRGRDVAELQRRLHIGRDGVFGPATRRAVLAFQRRHHLAADGVVGPRTAAALNGRANATRVASASSGASARTGTVARRGTAPTRGSSAGAAAVAEAARHRGKPYDYGAAGPNAFDCSGFVQYVYGQVGVSVPRTAAAQAASARRVSKADARLGDLVIIYTAGRVSHVGIYAGDHSMWVARRTGTTITRQTIYTDSYSIGRFV